MHPWESYADWNGTYLLTKDPDTLGSRIETIWTTHPCSLPGSRPDLASSTFTSNAPRATCGEVIWQRHTDRCTTMILGMDPRGLDEIGTIVEMIYPPCSK